jgi:hypothetical protein
VDKQEGPGRASLAAGKNEMLSANLPCEFLSVYSMLERRWVVSSTLQCSTVLVCRGGQGFGKYDTARPGPARLAFN